MPGLRLPSLAAVLMRRDRLLAAHRELHVHAGAGYWQAEIVTGPRSKTYLTKFELEELLDRLELEFTAT
jgi:hypothetical protein